MIKEKAGGGLDQSGWVQLEVYKGLGSEYMFPVESKGIADDLDVGCERKSFV